MEDFEFEIEAEDDAQALIWAHDLLAVMYESPPEICDDEPE